MTHIQNYGNTLPISGKYLFHQSGSCNWWNSSANIHLCCFCFILPIVVYQRTFMTEQVFWAPFIVQEYSRCSKTFLEWTYWYSLKSYFLSPVLCFLSETNAIDYLFNLRITLIVFLQMPESLRTPGQTPQVLFSLPFLHFLPQNTIAPQPSLQGISRNSFENFTMQVENEIESNIFSRTMVT